MSADVLVATRSDDKLREIQQITASLSDLRLLTLDDAGIEWSEQEEVLEEFESFEENALAKARYFHRRSGLPVMADDSGLCVDALGGAPGVLTKRFSGRSDLSGLDLDLANNEHLVSLLEGHPSPRTAHYVCAIALVTPDGAEQVFHGTLEGEILVEPRGTGGFGYDPLFFVPALNATLAEVQPEVKNRLSHRSEAVRKAIPSLHRIALAKT